MHCQMICIAPSQLLGGMVWYESTNKKVGDLSYVFEQTMSHVYSRNNPCVWGLRHQRQKQARRAIGGLFQIFDTKGAAQALRVPNSSAAQAPICYKGRRLLLGKREGIIALEPFDVACLTGGHVA